MCERKNKYSWQAERTGLPTKIYGGTAKMGIEAILGGVAFVGLFALWVVLPSRLRKSARSNVDSSTATE